MERERLVEIILETQGDYGWTCERAADLILSELAAEKATAPAGLVEELREWEGTIGRTISEDDWRLFEEILSRYSARKEVVLAEDIKLYSIREDWGIRVPEIDGHADLIGKRVKLIAVVEEDSK